jgi:hypothetical protein
VPSLSCLLQLAGLERPAAGPQLAEPWAVVLLSGDARLDAALSSAAPGLLPAEAAAAAASVTAGGAWPGLRPSGLRPGGLSALAWALLRTAGGWGGEIARPAPPPPTSWLAGLLLVAPSSSWPQPRPPTPPPAPTAAANSSAAEAATAELEAGPGGGEPDAAGKAAAGDAAAEADGGGDAAATGKASAASPAAHLLLFACRRLAAELHAGGCGWVHLRAPASLASGPPSPAAHAAAAAMPDAASLAAAWAVPPPQPPLPADALATLPLPAVVLSAAEAAELGEGDAAALALVLLRPPPSRAHTLDLTGCRLSGAGARVLLRLLRLHAASLTQLHLYGQAGPLAAPAAPPPASRPGTAAGRVPAAAAEPLPTTLAHAFCVELLPWLLRLEVLDARGCKLPLEPLAAALAALAASAAAVEGGALRLRHLALDAADSKALKAMDGCAAVSARCLPPPFHFPDTLLPQRVFRLAPSPRPPLARTARSLPVGATCRRSLPLSPAACPPRCAAPARPWAPPRATCSCEPWTCPRTPRRWPGCRAESAWPWRWPPRSRACCCWTAARARSTARPRRPRTPAASACWAWPCRRMAGGAPRQQPCGAPGGRGEGRCGSMWVDVAGRSVYRHSRESRGTWREVTGCRGPRPPERILLSCPVRHLAIGANSGDAWVYDVDAQVRASHTRQLS